MYFIHHEKGTYTAGGEKRLFKDICNTNYKDVAGSMSGRSFIA